MIFIALGSNWGDRAANLARARKLMVEAGMCIVAESGTMETAALLLPDSPPEWDIPYLNQVVQVEVPSLRGELLAKDLLKTLKHIESALGRVDRGRWAPREIDLDLVAYDALVMDTPSLTLPHPQMHLRDFVLKPLAEIAPDWHHPLLGKTVAELVAAV